MTLSAVQKKWLHAVINAAASGALSWVAFTLPSLVHLPSGLRGLLTGIAVAALSKTAGAVLAGIPHPDGP